VQVNISTLQRTSCASPCLPAVHST